MNQRTFTGILVAIAVIAAILSIWRPWSDDPTGTLRLGLDLQGGLRVVLQAETPDPDIDDLLAARNIIENRVNEFGVAEPLIQTSGGDRIIVELPGLTSEDQQRALDLIGQQAVLEFRLVRPQSQGLSVFDMTLADLEDIAFTGEIIRTARADFERVGATTLGPAVFFEIRAEDTRAFGDFTGRNIGRRMAIVLDGEIQTAPTLNSRISDSGQITGIGSLDEASDIALVLRSGSLPFNLNVEEIRAIGPTLGEDSIAAGTTAAFIGGAAVILFILAFYGPLFGGVLTLGLGLVMLFVFGLLAGLGAALTLPGLAGLVLTIGAAVDGNVISFERVREELRSGKGLRVALRNGFGNSLSAIIDANVTTLLAAAALYQYTAGPVRGFAITLAIGIVSAVFVNTVVVPWMLQVASLYTKKTFMRPGFFSEQLRFVKHARIALPLSAFLAVASILLLSFVGLRLSTDFTGGQSVLLRVPDGTQVADVRAMLDTPDFERVSASATAIVEVDDPTIAGQLLSVRVGLTESAEGADTFPTQLATAVGGEVLSSDFVGPAIGADLRRGAVLAVLVAFGLILVYTAWRFWPNWTVAIGTVVATVHDVGLVLGFLDLVQAEFSIPVLAALLFVVGYSLNDSIVISDRIRENLGKVRDRSFADIVDLSVSQTLPRTVVTSLTTLLPVMALFVFGGSVLRDFSMTLLVGVLVGAYSSVFVLAPIIVYLGTLQRRRRRARRATTATT
ncbi:MAG: protein translocase subunit SecD [Trueperaceae bacterium]|nr:MAG: protein translocase subunit SecD [Trueperaceae bacterium]